MMNPGPAGTGTRIAPYMVGPWMHANLAVSQSDIAFGFSAGNNGLAFVPLYAATLVGITVHTTAAVTAGTLTVSLFVNGADKGASYDLAMTTGTTDTLTFSTPLAVAAGDDVELKLSSDGDLLPAASNDITAWLAVK